MKKIWLQSYPEGVSEFVNPDIYSSIPDLLEESFNLFSDRPAFQNMGEVLHYFEIEELSRNFAAYLQQSLKMKQHETLAIMMPNVLQYPICLYGALRAGLQVANINPLYTSRELEHQLRDSEAKTIVIIENFAHVLESILDKTNIQHVIITKVGDLLNGIKGKGVNFVIKHVKKMVPRWNIPNSISFKKTLQEGKQNTFVKPKIEPEDIAFLQYTGGTTGIAKGAMLTHRNIVANTEQIKHWLMPVLEKENEVFIAPLPLYHIFSLTVHCFFSFSTGVTNILITNPRDLNTFIRTLKKNRFTGMTGVNTLYNALLHQTKFKKLDFHSLKFTIGGGMAVQKSVAEEWKQVTGKTLIEAYGLTETSPGVCCNSLLIEEFTGTIGYPFPSTEVCILDEKENSVSQGKEGELCVRGPQVMKGYWKRPNETKKVMTQDGWFKTGDIAKILDTGLIQIVDRKKDMILVSGFNVYPNEVEEEVAKHSKVLEVAAIGVPNKKSGEVVKICVVKKDPALTKEELTIFCKQVLTGYKVPKVIDFYNDLPKSNIGKILRRKLKENS